MKASLRALADSVLRNGLVQNAVALISGTVATQLVVFACSPILSRLFSPQDMGSWANYTAWVSVLALASSLRYEHAILVATGTEGAERAFVLTAVLSGISAILFLVAAAVLHFAHPDLRYVNQIREVLFYIPVGVVVACISSALGQLNVRAGEFRWIAIVTVIQSATTVLVQMALGFMHRADGLVIGAIAGQAAAAIAYLGTTLSWRDLRAMSRHLNLATLRETAVLHVGFPRYTLGADAITIIGQQFTPVLITAAYSQPVAGLYAFAVRTARVPLIVISMSVASVLRKEAADRAESPPRLQGLYRKSVLSLAAMAVVPLAVLLFFGPQLFTLVFGAEWSEAGRIAQILAPALVLEFVALPLGVFFLVTGKQRYSLQVQLVALPAMLLAIGLGRYWLNDVIAMCALLAVAMFGANLAVIVLAGRAARAPRSADVAPSVAAG